MKRTSKLKSILRSRLGMTYVELLTALALLALIIVAFTPMMLSSYETLYSAGELTQDTYNSKEEMEEGLARRDSEDSISMKLNLSVMEKVGDDYKVASDSVFEQVNVTGRKVISTYQAGLETIFGQVRARLEIVSPSTVYDNKSTHDIILQTYGLEYNKITFGEFIYDQTNEPNAVLPQMPEDQIHIEVIIPNKAAKTTGETANEDTEGTEDSTVYDYGWRAEIEYYDTPTTSKKIGPAGVQVSNRDESGGRIKLKISGPTGRSDFDKIDFTYSPLKVKVYYINTRGKLRTVSEYLYIEPASIIAAGETNSNIDYYTTAGVQAIDTSTDNTNRTVEYRFEAEGRKMRTSNSAYLSNTDSGHTEAKTAVGTPGSRGVSIRAIRWIDNDETAGINPYYVMAGSEGSIYRMYTFTSNSTDVYKYSIGKLLGTQGQGQDYKEKDLKNAAFFSGTQAYIDRVYNTETGKKIYPALWSGDFSHTFEYSSADQRVAYGPGANFEKGDATWLSSISKDGKQDDPLYNVFSAKTQFCYYYFGDATAHTFPMKNFKTISYVLTERGWPLRLAGTIRDGSDDYFEGYFSLWDTFSNGSSPDTYRVYEESDDVRGKEANYPIAFHYPLGLTGKLNTDTINDYTAATIKLKSLASYPLHDDLANGQKGYADYIMTSIGSRDGEDYENAYNMGKLANISRVQHDKGNERLVDKSGEYYGDNIEINDVIYIPSTGNTVGSTFYVGTVHAYAFLNQTDKVSDVDMMRADSTQGSENERGRYYWNKRNFWGTNQCQYPAGSISDYIILSDQDGRSTYIAMYSGTGSWPYDGDSRPSETTRKNAFIGFYQNYARDARTAANGSTISFNYGGQTFTGTFYDVSIDEEITQEKQASFFLPEKNNQWSFMKLEDVYFTFGYSSNRTRVYKYITYDGTTEYTRAAERLYWRSHYGQDAGYGVETDNNKFTVQPSNQSIFSGSALGNHTLNKALSTTSGFLQRGDYLNSYNNDQYNVWFPGEMYNLTKIASKDGVTVAVGYNVVGSAYQYSHYNTSSKYDSGKYHITSTALGGIYNDGVLCAMVEGQDAALVNLLYYKDNASFDGTSLTDFTINGKKPYEDYKNYTSNSGAQKQGYGTHARKSVEFTAVDILVESTKASETATSTSLNYYAYYGDNHGRLFMSLIASGNATSSGETNDNVTVDSDVSLVSFIKDTSYAGSTPTNKVGEMTEIKLDNGQSLSSVFTYICTVDIKDELILVTGEPAGTNTEKIVVGTKIENTDGTSYWSWRVVTNGAFHAAINDAMIVGGYYYLVGQDDNLNKGWIAGVSLDTLKDTSITVLTSPSYTDASIGCHSTDPNQVLWTYTDVYMYAVAGRDTN